MESCEETNLSEVHENSTHYYEIESKWNCQIVQASQESMEVDEIGDSLLNLDLTGANYTDIEETIHHNNELQEAQQEQKNYAGSLVGFMAATLDEIYEAYKKHAHAVGFGVRQSTTRYSQGSNQKIRSKEYVCTKQGFRCRNVTKSTPPSTAQKKRKEKQVPITRTGCKAYLRAKLNKEGMFEVDEYIMKHNHELTKQEWQHLHRSKRKITAEKGNTIGQMMQSGLRPTQSYALMAHEAGGINSVGHTLKDHFNYITRMKMKEKGGDAQHVIESLYQKQADNPDFFFRFKLGGEEKGSKLTTIFWRDSQMLDDFTVYGAVVVFDMTFRTNKYSLICAPIVGINNHWQTIMFGCAFIADESTTTFEWVLNTFKKSMCGVQPTSIFTDQDLAMAKPIEKVFPTSRHRLCIWHLIKNAVSRFGALKKDKTFKATFNKCLTGCVSEEEFEECWDQMIINYNLDNSKWFKRLYNLRDKWCTALSKDFFSAGVLSSQRSESTNNAIGFRANKNTSLTDFFKIFNQIIERWRRKESDADFKCAEPKPHTYLPMYGLLKHGSEVYTHTLFRDFELEYNYALGCIITTRDQVGAAYMYEVWIEDDTTTKQQVTFNSTNNMVECTCKNFEEVGWLCYHCIRVLLQNSVTRIPEAYIRKRWTKTAKAELWKKKQQDLTEKETTKNEKFTPWRTMMARKSYNLILKSQVHKETRKIFEENYKTTMNQVEELLSEQLEEPQSETQIVTNEEVQQSIPYVDDPDKANTKGRNKRIKGHFEKGKQPKIKKTKAMVAKENTREFGTVTPIVNPKLF